MNKFEEIQTMRQWLFPVVLHSYVGGWVGRGGGGEKERDRKR